MRLKITKLLKSHLKEAHRIYNYYISKSFSNFEEKKVTFSHFKNNYKKIIAKNLPYLGALDNEKVVGVAYLNNYREKSGYKFAFENTIYIDNEYIKKGIGNKLLNKLIITSKKNKNIKIIVAVISGIDSKGSIKIHKKNGFKKIGVLKKIGFKKGRWVDSILMQKNI